MRVECLKWVSGGYTSNTTHTHNNLFAALIAHPRFGLIEWIYTVTQYSNVDILQRAFNQFISVWMEPDIEYQAQLCIV